MSSPRWTKQEIDAAAVEVGDRIFLRLEGRQEVERTYKVVDVVYSAGYGNNVTEEWVYDQVEIFVTTSHNSGPKSFVVDVDKKVHIARDARVGKWELA